MTLTPISTFLTIVDKEQVKRELRVSRGRKIDGEVGPASRRRPSEQPSEINVVGVSIHWQ